MEYMLIRQCEVGETGDLSDFGWSQAKFLADKIKREFGDRKINIFSQAKKASLHTAGIIADRFLSSVSVKEEISSDNFCWLEDKIKSLDLFDEVLTIFIVDIDIMYYFPTEKLDVHKSLAREIRAGRGLHHKNELFSIYDYEF